MQGEQSGTPTDEAGGGVGSSGVKVVSQKIGFCRAFYSG